MPRFIAIPVGQGDAFYLERGNWSALVDGGRAQASFGTTFQTITGAASVDVLVCTHNDADHANGVIGFLESGLGCSEVWLPGRWLGALPSVLRSFTDVFAELADEVAIVTLTVKPPPLGATPLEKYAESLFERPKERETDGDTLREDGWPESLLEGLEQAEAWDTSPWLSCPEDPHHLVHLFSRYLQMRAKWIQLLWSAIEAASRIRAIAIAAFHRGIPVRWFEYEVTHPSGGCAELRPLNARAIARVRPSEAALLHLLALTVANKESLVFWSPQTDECPGVLFNADSDLNNVQLPANIVNAILTAPHHGSQANANAYSAVAAAAGGDAASLTWVRSDGRYRSRPGSAYRAVDGRRLCTICRLPSGRSSAKRPVRLFSRRGRWIRLRTTPECACPDHAQPSNPPP